MSEKLKTIKLNDKPVRCPLCIGWFKRIWSVSRKAYLLACHFDAIAIVETDPCVGRWEELYARGEKILCPACDHTMRYFCTSTGYMQAKCPKKKCRAKIENAQPDRKAGVTFLNAQGDPVAPPTGVDRPIASPENPGLLH